jgi:urease gamma subunit
MINIVIGDLISKERKKKEDKMKDKLRAFLITADATKSVLTGKSIDDVVEETITEDTDEQVLDYMNKLLGKVK